MLPARSLPGRLILTFACLTGLVLPAAALEGQPNAAGKPNAAGQPAKSEGGAGQTKSAGAPSLTADAEHQALGFGGGTRPSPVLAREGRFGGVIGEQPTRTKVKRRKAPAAGKPAISGEAQRAFGSCWRNGDGLEARICCS